MQLQTRSYRFVLQQTEIRNRILAIGESTNLKGWWIDRTNFVVKRKGPLGFIRIYGDISEVKKNWKLRLVVDADFRYFLLYIIPAALIIYSRTRIGEGRLLFLVAGFSLAVLFILITSASIYNLKRRVKEELQII